MESYKERMKVEYQQLKERHEKLHLMIVKCEAGMLDFKPTCPIGLLREQESVMARYLYILEVRAQMEEIDIQEA